MLDCLRPLADPPANAGGARQRELEGSDEQVDDQGVIQGVGEVVQQGEPSRQEDSKRQSQESSEGQGLDRCARGHEHAKNRFRLHACWAKAGHDMLEERAPFLLSVLHKVYIPEWRKSRLVTRYLPWGAKVTIGPHCLYLDFSGTICCRCSIRHCLTEIANFSCHSMHRDTKQSKHPVCQLKETLSEI